MAGIAYYDKAEVFIDGKQIGTALDLGIEFKHNTKRTRDEAIRNLAPFADPKPLPKPTRVEKWQRWRNQGAEYVVTEIRDGAFDRAYFADGQCCSMYEMRASSSWTFLGYAKPDKVEVGQRWHQTGFGVRVVAALECGDKLAKFRDGGAQLCRMITENTMMEYLGMAESSDGDWKTATGEALDREAKRNGFVRSIGETDEKLRVRFASPADSKTEARRANEEAAKRLIANPPEWAYPKAWMCAVLWCMEQHGDRSALLDSLDEGAAWMFIGLYQRLRGEGMTHESALDKATKREVPIVRDIVNAYARGMERQVPRMGRSGVKGGISTCDLGVDYE